MTTPKSQKAFTLTEIMIVVILVGIIAGFALPNYSRSMERAYARDAVIQLTALNAANAIYRAHANGYLCGTGLAVASINSNLGLNIIPSSATLTYSYSNTGLCAGSNPQTAAGYTATAAYTGGFTLSVTHAPISASNPCCSANCGNIANPAAC